MFDFMDVMFWGIEIVVGLMCLAPFIIIPALMYFGLFRKETDYVNEPEEMYTPEDSTQQDNIPQESTFDYDPSYMKIGKTELTFRTIQYSMMAVLMIIMPVTMFFGFETDIDLCNGLSITKIISFGMIVVCGIVFAVTGLIANLMKRVRIAEYVGKRFFS